MSESFVIKLSTKIVVVFIKATLD